MRQDDSLFVLLGVLMNILLAVALIALVFKAFEPTPVREPGVAAVAATDANSDVSSDSSTDSEESGSNDAKPALFVAQTDIPVVPDEIGSIFNRSGCAGCHVIPGVLGANGQIGPDLSKIGLEAAQRVAGLSAAEYISQSIVDPNAFIAPACPNGACPEGVMLQSFAQMLSASELDVAVAYLATLGTDQQQELALPAAQVAMDLSLPAESVLEPFAALPKAAADPAMIALGKYLFFDPRLSGNNSLSCASCHQPDHAFTDAQPLSRGYPSTASFRNTPTLYNTVFADYLYLDGRMDGGDMPTLVRDHLTEAHFMSMDGRLMFERLKQVPEYVEMFDEVFGGEPSFGKVLNSVTAYVQSLNSPPAPYDAYLAGDAVALSDDAIAGLALFEGKALCSTCHSGALLTDGGFYNIGVATDPTLFQDPERHVTFRRFFRILGVPAYRGLTEDVGLYALTLDDVDRGAFHTPSLREAVRTAPYMHDGSMQTLTEVVQFYNQGGGPGQTAGLESLDLTEAEIAQLVAFLESLSSDTPAVDVPVLPAYDLLALGSATQPVANATEVKAPAITAGEDAEVAEVVAEPEADSSDDSASAEVEEVAVMPVTDELVSAFTKGTCTACHVIPDIPGAIGQIGPSMEGMGETAATRVDGLSAEAYIRQSIMEPNAFITPDCPLSACLPNLMPATLSTLLTEDELNLIVQYLVSLEGGQ